jgi:hypothetical protein
MGVSRSAVTDGSKDGFAIGFPSPAWWTDWVDANKYPLSIKLGSHKTGGRKLDILTC